MKPKSCAHPETALRTTPNEGGKQKVQLKQGATHRTEATGIAQQPTIRKTRMKIGGGVSKSAVSIPRPKPTRPKHRPKRSPKTFEIRDRLLHNKFNARLISLVG
jgi:hypothetical protein